MPSVSEQPEIQWREIFAMCNQLIHGYLGIDLDIVCYLVCVELSALPNHCQDLGKFQPSGE